MRCSARRVAAGARRDRGVPLRALLRRLATGPPRLGAAVALLGDLRAYAAIRDLSERFLDRREATRVAVLLRAGAGPEAAERFCRAFSDRHFPLDDGGAWEGDVALAVLPCTIPYAGDAWAWDERLEVLDHLRPGYQLLWLLCGDAADDDLRATIEDDPVWRDGALLGRIPPGGWPPRVLAERLHGTRYAPASEAAAWIHGATGNVWLDIPWGEGPDIPWAEADALAADWRAARQLQRRVQGLVDWLEDDFSRRAHVLVDAILAAESAPCAA